jgi:hypothetical protein
MDRNGNEKESIMRKFMRRYYGPTLMLLPVKIIVFLVFAGLLGANIYGCSQMPLQFDVEWFIYEDHELQDTFDARDSYFDSKGMHIKVYTVDCDFSDEEVQ